MAWTELATEVVDPTLRARAVRHLRQARVVLPTFAELADPGAHSRAPSRLPSRPSTPMPPHAGNLFRVHWYNDERRTGLAAVPLHLELPEALTGVKARILVALGARLSR